MLCNPVNVVKTAGLHTLNGRILWHVNDITLRLFKKKMDDKKKNAK